MKNQQNAIILKPGKDKPIRHRHHWIFSGAVASLPSFDDGDILPVLSADGDLLGHAYANHKTSILARMISFGNMEPIAAVRENIARAFSFRKTFFDPKVTNAYRLIYGEGDGIPGLTVDVYNNVVA